MKIKAINAEVVEKLRSKITEKLAGMADIGLRAKVGKARYTRSKLHYDLLIKTVNKAPEKPEKKADPKEQKAFKKQQKTPADSLFWPQLDFKVQVIAKPETLTPKQARRFVKWAKDFAAAIPKPVKEVVEEE